MPENSSNKDLTLMSLVDLAKHYNVSMKIADDFESPAFREAANNCLKELKRRDELTNLGQNADKIRFVVLENCKLCKYPQFEVDTSWDNCVFNTFEEAKKYANSWLGNFGPYPHEESNTVYCYNGADHIAIASIK